MKDVAGTSRDDDPDEVFPSDNCSDDVAATAAVAQSSSSSGTHCDRIVCGDCRAEFSLSTFTEFVEHKVWSVDHLLVQMHSRVSVICNIWCWPVL